MNNKLREFRFDDVRCVAIQTKTAHMKNNQPLEIVYYMINKDNNNPVSQFSDFPNCNAVRVNYDEDGYLKDVCFGNWHHDVHYSLDALDKRFTCHYRVVYKNLIYSEDGLCKLIGIKIDENLKNWTAQDGIDLTENDLKLDKKILS